MSKVAPHAIVTGGAGFLGSHLVDSLLRDGFFVTVVDDLSSGSLDNLKGVANNRLLSVEVADICEYRNAPRKVDFIFNLASLASPSQYLTHPYQTLRANSEGVQRVIDLSIHANARLVQASTSEVYGTPLIHPQTEEYWGNVNPVGPRSVYDEGKRFAEALIASYVRRGLLDAGIVRIFNTYGPRQSPSDGRVISSFVNQALSGVSLVVHGDGSQTRSFCYVDDLITGVRSMAEQLDFLGPVNLGSQAEITILDLAKLVCELTGRPQGILHAALRVDDPVHRQPDISLARARLGWNPATELRTGLHRTIMWQRMLD